jgi:hypothetical protein
LISFGLRAFCARWYRQICRPVSASSATTVPGGPLVYITPSTTSGVASRTELPGSCRAHAAWSRFTFDAVICERPE